MSQPTPKTPAEPQQAAGTPVWVRYYPERAGGRMQPERGDCYHKYKECQHLWSAKTRNTEKDIRTVETTEADAIQNGYSRCDACW